MLVFSALAGFTYLEVVSGRRHLDCGEDPPRALR